MAYTPTTLTFNPWASPISVLASDEIGELDNTVNSIITGDSNSLVNFTNREMATIPGYLSAELTSLHSAVSSDANVAASAASASASAASAASAESWAEAAEAANGYIASVVEDTTPQLGGNLDINGFDIAGFATDAEVALKSPTASPTFTGTVTTDKLHSTGLVSYDNTVFTTNIDCSLGNGFSKTVTANYTQTFTNVPSSGTACILVLVLTNSGGYTTTWSSSILWIGGVEPIWTTTGTDIVTLYTIDGGTNWYATTALGFA